MKLLNFKKGKKVCEHSVYYIKDEGEKAIALIRKMLQDSIERLRAYGQMPEFIVASQPVGRLFGTDIYTSESLSADAIVVMNANREVVIFNHGEDISLRPIGMVTRDSGAGETIEVSLFGNDNPLKEDEETDLGNLTGDRERADAEN